MTFYRQSGIEPALKRFREQVLTESDRQFMARAPGLENSEIRANVTYWFERELRQYAAVDLDLDVAQSACRSNRTRGRAGIARLSGL
jgi:hypothetical protein